ncbi:MAG: ABC transporter permease [Anaerolineales bacterium]|jgi:ribose/xylose/arabinose/galactoside ABC-type transport system permease subunit
MNSRKIILWVLNNLIWFLLLLTVIFFALISKHFLTRINLTNIVIHAAVIGLLVVGQVFTLVTGNFDLSSEATLGLTALIAAWLMLPKGAPTFGGGILFSVYLAVPIMLLIGVLIGLINGLLITRLKANAFIVTLTMQLIIRGVMMPITAGNTMARLPADFKFLGNNSLGPIPISVIVLVVAFAIGHIILQYRPFGRSLFAVGGNKTAALAAGINPDRRILQVYVISGLMAAIAGWLMAGRTGVIVQNMGQGYIFEVMAASVIGGISLNGGRGTMVGAFGGVLLLSTIESGLSLMRISTFWIEIASGLIILIAMLIDAQKVRFTSSQAAPLAKISAKATASESAGND